MSNKKILIIDKHPFGGLTDTYKWCEYLRLEYKVTIVTINDRTTKPLTMDRVNIVRATSSNRLIRGCLFTLLSLLYILFNRSKTIIVYYDGCTIYKRLMPWKKIILDIRTLAVNMNEEYRKSYDERIKQACNVFDFLTIISQGLADKLQVNPSKYTILPLGSDEISSKNKTYDSLRLLYVGTFNGRNIHETVLGIAKFLQDHPNSNINYDIIGTGTPVEKQKITDTIAQNNLKNIVKLHGYVPHTELATFFDQCNIGVSYIPCTEYYDYQPPTKTFEYCISGLFCIATNTSSNREVINNSNGIIVDSNDVDFARGLKTVYENKDSINEIAIRDSLKQFTWKNIVNKYLKPVIEK